MVNKNGFGFFRTYELGIIASLGFKRVDIAENDKSFMGFFNVVDISNYSSEHIEVWIDGNEDRKLLVRSGTGKSMNDTRFRELVVKNVDAVNATSDKEIVVSIQKYIGKREEMELNTDRVLGDCKCL